MLDLLAVQQQDRAYLGDGNAVYGRRHVMEFGLQARFDFGIYVQLFMFR